MFCDILQLFTEVWVARLFLNMYKTAQKVLIAAQIFIKKTLFASEKEVLITDNFDKFWPNLKFWLFLTREIYLNWL